MAVDLRDTPVHVKREKNDFGSVQVPLRPVPLPLSHSKEIAVLVNATDLPCQCHDQLFIVLRESLSLVPDETDPAVDMGR